MATSPPPPYLITRPPPDAVTYDLTTPHRARITLPARSRWTSGLHWHETHTEYLLVVRGAIRVRLGVDAHTLVLSAAAGAAELAVAPYTWHEWARAEEEGEEVEVVERTEPADGDKALFFWNLNGVVLRGGRPWWTAVGLWTVFGALDNFPVFVDLPGVATRCGWAVREGEGVGRVLAWVEWCWTHVVLLVASWVGWVGGLRAVRREFTPEREYAEWMARQGARRKEKAG